MVHLPLFKVILPFVSNLVFIFTNFFVKNLHGVTHPTQVTVNANHTIVACHVVMVFVQDNQQHVLTLLITPHTRQKNAREVLRKIEIVIPFVQVTFRRKDLISQICLAFLSKI